MQGIGDLAGGSFASEAFAVSGDGQFIVGQSQSGSGAEAFRWDVANGMQPLGDLDLGDFDSAAYGVSGDGRVVVRAPGTRCSALARSSGTRPAACARSSRSCCCAA